MTFDYRAAGPNSIYSKLVTKIDKYETDALTFADSAADVEREIGRGGNIQWVVRNERGEKEPKMFLIFGEIGTRDEGTRLGARGKALSSMIISDAKNIKAQIALRLPTAATDELRDLWNDQFATLDELYMAAEGGIESIHNTPWINRRPFYKDRTIPLTTSYLYKKVDAVASSGPIVRSNRKRGAVPGPAGTAMPESSAPEDQVEEKYRAQGTGIDATYSVDCLPDHVGPMFRHAASRVVQLDFQDKDGQLVQPWRIRDVFRPGTLVLAWAALYRWNIPDQKTKNIDRTYQLQVRSMAVLDDSPLDAEPIFIPTDIDSSATTAGIAAVSVGAKRKFFTLDDDDEDANSSEGHVPDFDIHMTDAPPIVAAGTSSQADAHIPEAVSNMNVAETPVVVHVPSVPTPTPGTMPFKKKKATGTRTPASNAH